MRNLGPRHAAFDIWRAGSPEAAAYLEFERTAPGGRLVAADEVAGAAQEHLEASRLPRRGRRRATPARQVQSACTGAAACSCQGCFSVLLDAAWLAVVKLTKTRPFPCRT